MRFLYKCFTDYCTILKHVFQINQITVVHMLSIIVSIMEMNNTFIMSINNILRK